MSKRDPENLAEVLPTALSLKKIVAGYERSVVLRDVRIDVPAGKVVALLGANGMGKTTTLRVASGLLRLTSGSVEIGGVDMTHASPHDRARAGLCLIPEGRGIFRELTVAENLRLQVPRWVDSSSNIDQAMEAFPILGKRLHQHAGNMSGGEQQMLALSRAYLAAPSVVLVDEVSTGLSPLIVDQIFGTFRDLAGSGVALLIVEQYVHRALELADYLVVLDRGSVLYSGKPSEVEGDFLLRSYLGADA
jgi:branched-chain amino acid transport system ATP-binding protein